MKKISFLLICFLLAKASTAQYSLFFCENVSEDGKPQNISTSFQVNEKGSAFKVFVRGDENFNSDSIIIKFYYINSKGDEERLERYAQKVERNWNFVWKEFVFFNEGTYRVKVYNDNEIYLTSANVDVQLRK